MGSDDADTEHDLAPPDAPTVQARPGGKSPAPGRNSSAPTQEFGGASRSRETGLGRYDLGEVLGRGGMGEVISARDEQIGRAVAIKRMRADQPSPAAVARFLREARIQGQLEHPAIVPIHELSRDAEGHPYFVMKQLTGITLSDILKALAEGDPDTAALFPRQRLLRAFCEVCLAVEFAHSRNIVHRDLKPANIMLGDFGEVHVLDWGIARAIDEAPERVSTVDVSTFDGEQTEAGLTLGTPGYMSSEQLRADPRIDGRSDVYALGCILFEILALAPLHPRNAPTAAVDHTPSVRAPEREIPPELDAICLAATMTDREDRYASARELGDAVQRFLDGDRDLALRKQLALAELDTARAALARDDRPVSIRAAARALALDPASRDAADLVARLMIEPPATIPPEVERAIERVDIDALYASRTLIAGGGLVFAAFIPLLMWTGFRDVSFVVTAIVLAAVVGSCAFAAKPGVVLWTRISLAGIVLAVALAARILTPFLVAPGLAAAAGMTIATHPRVARAWLLVVVFTAAVLGPWLLELAGVLSSTTSIVDDTFVLRAAARMDAVPAMIALVAYVVMMLGLSISFGARLTNERRKAQRVVQLQTWQLGQLVPHASPVQST